MGSVWAAEHIELGTQLAVKLMDPTLADSPEWARRFKREAQAAASLDSPNIVRVFDYGIDEGTPYIAMELLRGESLAQRLLRCGRIDVRTLGNIYLQLGKALTKAHQLGIVHRDLKPANILLLGDDDGDIAKVIDFGIAKRAHALPEQGSELQTATGAMIGTPFYMSPEQASGSKDVDFRTDIWALGIIAYECILGKRPYYSDSLGNLVLQICTEPHRVPSQVAEVPDGFDEWYARCTAKSPRDRFPSARDAAIALHRIAQSERSLDSRPLRVTSEQQGTVPTNTCSAADSYVPVHQGGSTALTSPDAEHRQAKKPWIGARSGAILAVFGVAVAIGGWWHRATTRYDGESGSAPLPESSLSVSAMRAKPSTATGNPSRGQSATPDTSDSTARVTRSAERAPLSRSPLTDNATSAERAQQAVPAPESSAKRGKGNSRGNPPAPKVTSPAVTPEPKTLKPNGVFQTREG